jgi:outer membrane murein-binding lipoprotein Lpp
MPPDAKKVKALQLNLEGLFRLLGGSSEDKQRFLEMIIGITTPVEIRLINAQIDALSAHTKAVQAGAKALQTTAQQIARRG